MNRTEDHGRPGPQTSEGMRDLWRGAAELNAAAPGQGEWVPWRAIHRRPELLPRANPNTDREVAERYAAAFDLLPPIVVQRDTFVLIDGSHRLEAAPLAHRDHIRIVEKDIADDDLEDEACRANVSHGLPLTADERRKAAQRMYARHHPDTGGMTGQAWTTGRIAEWSGCHRNTINEWLARDRQKAHEAAERETTDGAVAQIVRQAATRIGTDGREVRADRPATGAAAAPRSPAPLAPQRPASSYQPISKPAPTGRTQSGGDWLDAFREILERSPRDVAEDVPEEIVPGQLREALRMARWWEAYAEALEARVPVRAGSNGNGHRRQG